MKSGKTIQTATNQYLTKCGMSYTIDHDRQSALHLWYKLHRKKCPTCKDIPFKKRYEYEFDNYKKEDHSLQSQLRSNPDAAPQIFKLKTNKEPMPLQ